MSTKTMKIPSLSLEVIATIVLVDVKIDSIVGVAPNYHLGQSHFREDWILLQEP